MDLQRLTAAGQVVCIFFPAWHFIYVTIPPSVGNTIMVIRHLCAQNGAFFQKLREVVQEHETSLCKIAVQLAPSLAPGKRIVPGSGVSQFFEAHHGVL